MSHKHEHGHKHSHEVESVSGARLLFTMSLNFLITIAEIIGGIVSGSLSLISDALHNFSDGIAIIISYAAIKIKGKPNSPKHTFGFKRSEILAAFINSAVLVAISFYLFYEAVARLITPTEIEGKLMTIVASVGLAANVLGTLLLKTGAKENINIRSAYLHLLSDAVSSFAVILGGLAIYFYDIYWLDPVLTLLISAYILKESYEITKSAIHVLMEGAPESVNLEEIKAEAEKFDAVKDIHHVHVWALGENDIHLEAHVNVKDMPVSESDFLRKKLEKIFREKFGVVHCTLQFECDACENKELIASDARKSIDS
jgi:cobalt-zinc-cadmium efflux system protein